MMRRLLLLTFALCTTALWAQKEADKAEADQRVCKELLAMQEPTHWHPEFVWEKGALKETNERNVYCVAGEAFQVKSVRSDFFVTRARGKWQPIFDRRFPVESMANLLLARIQDDSHLVELRHHQYGNHIALMTIPLQRLHDLFGPTMEMYCRVGTEGNDGLSAWLIFYHRQKQYIHLLELKSKVGSLFTPGAAFQGDFYTNIPQGNIKSLMGTYKEK